MDLKRHWQNRQILIELFPASSYQQLVQEHVLHSTKLQGFTLTPLINMIWRQELHQLRWEAGLHKIPYCGTSHQGLLSWTIERNDWGRDCPTTGMLVYDCISESIQLLKRAHERYTPPPPHLSPTSTLPHSPTLSLTHSPPLSPLSPFLSHLHSPIYGLLVSRDHHMTRSHRTLWN